MVRPAAPDDGVVEAGLVPAQGTHKGCPYGGRPTRIEA
jgi:hypothetical protein